MTIFEALTSGLNDSERNLTLDVIQERFADDQETARQGRPHRVVQEITRRRRSARPAETAADGGGDGAAGDGGRDRAAGDGA